MLNELEVEVFKSLTTPQQYVEYLEEKYSDILEMIETKNVCLLVMSKQRSYLEYLMKNGEINDRSFELLKNKLTTKELRLKQMKV